MDETLNEEEGYCLLSRMEATESQEAGQQQAENHEAKLAVSLQSERSGTSVVSRCFLPKSMLVRDAQMHASSACEWMLTLQNRHPSSS